MVVLYWSFILVVHIVRWYCSFILVVYIGDSYWSFIGRSIWLLIFVVHIGRSYWSSILVVHIGRSYWSFILVVHIDRSYWSFILVVYIGRSYWSFIFLVRFSAHIAWSYIVRSYIVRSCSLHLRICLLKRNLLKNDQIQGPAPWWWCNISFLFMKTIGNHPKLRRIILKHYLHVGSLLQKLTEPDSFHKKVCRLGPKHIFTSNLLKMSENSLAYRISFF